MIVTKFGGSSVADAERILAVADIVRGCAARRPVVVVSALAGVTDLLVQAVEAARAGDLEGLDPVLADLERRHRWALGGCIEDAGERHDLSLEVGRLFEDLRQRLRSVRILGEGTPRAVDAILACGELLAAPIVAAAFRSRGLDAVPVDPREVLRTDERHGRAEPLLEAVAANARATLLPLLEAGKVPVLGGFVGATAAGETTTLGRGGSDTSAAVLGAAIDAEEIQIWSDVDGLMSADPRLVPAARTIPRLTFAEAAELAGYGAKVLHPDSIAPAVSRQIPVRVLNARRPDGAGSVILDAEPNEARPELVSVASRAGVCSLRVLSPRMRADPDFLARILDLLRDRRIAPELLVATEVAVHLVLPAGAPVDELERELAARGRVELRRERAIVCVVGAGMAGEGRARPRVLRALAACAPELVGVGASPTGLAAVVPEGELTRAVGQLHREFFE